MLKKLFNKLKNGNNKGSSFVVVVVTTTFIALITTAILSLVMMFCKRSMIANRSTNEFYNVEKALDQVKQGITDMASINLQQAYEETVADMVYYDVNEGVYKSKTNEQANKEFKEKFYSKMKDCYGGDSATADTMAIYSTFKTYFSEDDLNVMLTDPSVAGGELSSYAFNRITDDTNQTITITGLYFKTKDTALTNGYQQTLYTDITIDVPDVTINFINNNSDIDTILQFWAIADDGIDISSNNSVKFTGNIYAGVAWDENQITLNTKYKETQQELINKKDFGLVNSGILVSSSSKSGTSVIFNCDKLITGGNIVADNGSSITFHGVGANQDNEIWCRNIVTSQSDNELNKASIYGSGNMYVYDDLEVNAKESYVALSGKFTGYNYGTFGSNSVSTTGEEDDVFATGASDVYGKHYNSSSIIINGEDSTLEMTNLSSLTIAGRSYIDYSNGQSSYVTGESMSIRANQLAYVVPKSMLKYDSKTQKMVLDYATVDAQTQAFLNGLLDNSLDVYPTITGSEDAVREKTYYFFFKDTNSGLTATEKAYKYIAWYTGDSNPYRDYSGDVYDIEGNKYNNGTTVQGVRAVTINNNGGTEVLSNGAITLKSFAKNSENEIVSSDKGVEVQIEGTLSPKFSQIQSDSINNYSDLRTLLRYKKADDSITSDESPIIRYLNLIDGSNNLSSTAKDLVTACKAINGKNNKMIIDYLIDKDTTKTSDNYKVVVSDEDYVLDLDEDFKGIIICTDNVTIKNSTASNKTISGIIICGGKIIIDSSSVGPITIQASADVVQAILDNGVSTEGGTIYQIAPLFNIKINTINSGDITDPNAVQVDEDKVLRDFDCSTIVGYENWKKSKE